MTTTNVNNIILPKTKIVAERKSPRLILIYGPPKCGKTTVLSQLDGCCTIDTEDGSDFVDSLKIKCPDWVSLQLIGKQILAENKPYKTIAVDTIDMVETWAEKLATQNYRNLPLGKSFAGRTVLELPQGAGYLHLRQAFLQILDFILPLANRTILIGHIRDKMIDSADKTTSVSSKDLDLTGKLKNIVCSRADAIGYMNRNKEGKLVITFDTKEDVNCGSRCEHLKGKTFDFDWSKIYID